MIEVNRLPAALLVTGALATPASAVAHELAITPTQDPQAANIYEECANDASSFGDSKFSFKYNGNKDFAQVAMQTVTLKGIDRELDVNCVGETDTTRFTDVSITEGKKTIGFAKDVLNPSNDNGEVIRRNISLTKKLGSNTKIVVHYITEADSQDKAHTLGVDKTNGFSFPAKA